MYNLPEKTKDALRSDNYRKRNEQARTNLVLAKHINNKGEGNTKMKTQIILNPNSAEKESIISKKVGEPIRLHLKLHNEWLDEDSQRILNKYGIITEEELAEAKSAVIRGHRPVCIHQDGMCLVDDVGGLGGFINMLRILYETDERDEIRNPYDPDTKENTLVWAHSMGWSARKISNKQML